MGLDVSNHRVFIVSAKFGPAPAGGRGPVLPGSFTLMVIERDSVAHHALIVLVASPAGTG